MSYLYTRAKHSLLALLILLISAPLAHAGIQLKSVSLNSLLNTSQAVISNNNNKKNLGSADGSFQHGLVALKVKYRYIANTTLSPENHIQIVNYIDIFEAVEPEIIGKALIYPNPFRLSDGTELGYMLSKNMDTEVQIYDMLGHRVFQNTFKAGTPGGVFGYNKLTLNYYTMSYDLSAGVYFFLISNNGKVLQKGKFAIIP
ncbi:T9SS type A sorting domain-containing protein [bacterium]|jgi:hypothetical protein|nr:T9SS type A sorting domain-containing protein [bacterium]